MLGMSPGRGVVVMADDVRACLPDHGAWGDEEGEEREPGSSALAGETLPDGPWQQQEGEPDVWYGRFVSYYLLAGPDRSLRAACRQWRRHRAASVRAGSALPLDSAPPESWRRAQAHWHWQERAAAWDAYNRQQQFAEAERERIEMLRRQRALGVLMQTAAGIYLRHLVGQLEAAWAAGGGNAIEAALSQLRVPPAEYRRLAIDGAGLERAAAGLPGVIVSIMRMTDGELCPNHLNPDRGIETMPGPSGHEGKSWSQPPESRPRD